MLIRPHRESDRETIKQITIDAFEGVTIEQNIEKHFGPFGGSDWRGAKARHRRRLRFTRRRDLGGRG